MKVITRRFACTLGFGLLGLIGFAPVFSADVPASQWVGDWLAPAEDENDVDAIITLSREKGVWQGHIQTVRVTRPNQPYTDITPCSACTGNKKGKPFKGLEVIWGLHETPEGLQGGQILDPSDGSIYSCEIRVTADARKIEVVAYKGLRWLGHTMVWQRP